MVLGDPSERVDQPPKGSQLERLRTTALYHFAGPTPIPGVFQGALEGPLLRVTQCPLSGAGLDPKWRVHVKCWPHYRQLTPGSRAATERT